MTLGEVLDRARRMYVDEFVAMTREAQASGYKVLTEIAMRNAAGKAIEAGDHPTGVRLDVIVCGSDGKPEKQLRINSSRQLSFDTLAFTWEKSLEVWLHPLWWDCLEFRLKCAVSPPDYRPLFDWFKKWFSEDSDGVGEPLGLVHSLTHIRQDGDTITMHADLGTAPVETFEELLDALVAMRITEAHFGRTAPQLPFTKPSLTEGTNP